MNPWLLLILAILFEIAATSLLKASQGFTYLGTGIVAMIGYACSLILLALVLQSIPLGVAYAIWSGLGIVILTIIGTIVYGDTIPWTGIIGIGLITLGAVLTSLSTGH